MSKRLTARFYQRPTPVVARALLGKVLVHGQYRARITECEAYLGPEDLASHARFGRTKRSHVMFEAGGRAYVYLCYGVHMMFNVVTDRANTGGAVLIRAATILQGSSLPPERTNGPGKLTRALELKLCHNRVDLVKSDSLYISSGLGAQRIKEDRVHVGPRIGVDYAGKWKSAPLRFVVA